MKHYCRFFFAFLVAVWLVACSAFEAPQPTAYRPPTVVVPTLPAAATATQALPTVTPAPPACEDNLTFLEDLTVPDGTYVDPGVVLDKRWKVINSGTCNWDAQYHFKLVEGPAMSTIAEQALFPARSGSEAVIRLVFVAPTEPGRYRSAWQAVSPEGETFGDPIYIEIIVNGL